MELFIFENSSTAEKMGKIKRPSIRQLTRFVYKFDNEKRTCPSIWVQVETGSGVISQSSLAAASSRTLINVDLPVAIKQC